MDENEDKKGVLIVEDEEDIIYLLKKILAKNGHNVLGTAKDGAEAFQKYKELKPGLVTLDIMMHPVDGRIAAHKILKFDPNANIVVVSVLDKDQLSDMAGMGIRDFIKKPIDPERLTGIVDATMQSIDN